MFDLKTIKSFAPFCLACLGRSFGKIGFGIDNRERGIEILNQLEIQEGVDFDDDGAMSSAQAKSLHAMVPVMKRSRKQFANSSGLQQFLKNLS